MDLDATLITNCRRRRKHFQLSVRTAESGTACTSNCCVVVESNLRRTVLGNKFKFYYFSGRHRLSRQVPPGRPLATAANDTIRIRCGGGIARRGLSVAFSCLPAVSAFGLVEGFWWCCVKISMCLGSTARQWSPTDIGAAWLEPVDRAGGLGRRVDPLDPRAGAPARYLRCSNASFRFSNEI